MVLNETDQLTSLVARVLRIEAVTWGEPGSKTNNFIANFQGKLFSEDTSGAYDTLAGSLRPLDITPLFRLIDGRHHVILMPGIQDPKPSNARVNIILFLLTLASVFLTWMLFSYDGPWVADWQIIRPHLLNSTGLALAFTVSLLSILLAHEFGHYLMARHHKTAASLPYFIPLPLTPLGTMGAVIVQKESHKNKRILLDIGIAGPLAGLVVAIPVLLIGLNLSEISRLSPAGGIQMEGNSILYLLAKYAVFSQWLPSPASYGDSSPFLYWVTYFFTGRPSPLGGMDVNLHPVAFAGWAGILVTALNLIPAGQLDGGHIVNGLMGRRAAALVPFVLVGLAALGVVWPGWWLWAFLIFFLGRSSAEPLDQITPLDGKRRFLGVAAMVIFILVFTPVPLQIIG